MANNINESVEVIFFNATWCNPCQQMKPSIEKLVKEGYPIEMVDVEENSTLAENAEVRGVPTTAIYENGVMVERLVGLQDEKLLKRKIDVYYKK